MKDFIRSKVNVCRIYKEYVDRKMRSRLISK